MHQTCLRILQSSNRHFWHATGVFLPCKSHIFCPLVFCSARRLPAHRNGNLRLFAKPLFARLHFSGLASHPTHSRRAKPLHAKPTAPATYDSTANCKCSPCRGRGRRKPTLAVSTPKLFIIFGPFCLCHFTLPPLTYCSDAHDKSPLAALLPIPLSSHRPPAGASCT